MRVCWLLCVFSPLIYFLAEKQTEQVISITMALAMELSVTRERVATLECLLEEKGIISRTELDNYKPNADEVARRSIDIQECLARILLIIQQNSEDKLLIMNLQCKKHKISFPNSFVKIK